jgi:hypothetical protein
VFKKKKKRKERKKKKKKVGGETGVGVDREVKKKEQKLT